jgi:hypothetical protein
MNYMIKSATSTIATPGDLDDNDHQDRVKRIASAADTLNDWTHEELLDNWPSLRAKLAHDDIQTIATLVSMGMMMQYEHDEKSTMR